MQIIMTEVVSDNPMDTDSAEEGEIRDSEDERRRSRPAPAPPLRKSLRARMEPKRSTASRRPPVSKRRPVRSHPHPPHRKKRHHPVEEEEDDVETMIARARRRMQASGKDVFSIPKEAAAVPSSSPAIPVEAAAVSKEPRMSKNSEEVDEIQVLEVPPKVFELVELADDDKAEAVEEMREDELLALRLVALKSSIQAKWGNKKDKSAPDDQQPYSPTGPIDPVEENIELESPAPSPPVTPPPLLEPADPEEDEEDLRTQLLEQMKKNDDKENMVSDTTVNPSPPPPPERNEVNHSAIDNFNSLSSGRIIVRLGPDSSDSDSESERESASNVDSSIEMMLKKLRSNVERPQTKDKDECLRENSDNGAAKGAKKVNGKIHVDKNGQLPKNNPLSHLPKSRQAEYLRLKALLKKKEEVRRQRIAKADYQSQVIQFEQAEKEKREAVLQETIDSGPKQPEVVKKILKQPEVAKETHKQPAVPREEVAQTVKVTQVAKPPAPEIVKSKPKLPEINKEPRLPSLSALSQALPLLSQEERAARLAALEFDLTIQRERREEQETRVTELMGRLVDNKKQKAAAAAAREAAKAKQLEQEARLNLLRQQLAEAEEQAAAAATEAAQANITTEQLALEAPALEASLNIAREEVARLRAGCKLLRDACAQARGDREAEALQQQLDVLGALASAPLQYNSPLDHIRSGQGAGVDPNRQLCPLFLTVGGCSLGPGCIFQHP